MTSFLDTSKPLAGRVAIITGSGRNIGKGIALSFARAGAKVVLNGHRNEDALKQVASEIEAMGGEAMTFLADVSKPEQVKAMVDASIKHFGGVDIAISNNLLISNRKLRRKLEIILEKSNFASVEYLDDIVKTEKEKKEKAPKKKKFSNYLFQQSSIFIRLLKSSIILGIQT